MKYLFFNGTFWLFLLVLPLCITAINLDAWMPKVSVQKKSAAMQEKQELVMNPLFIFK